MAVDLRMEMRLAMDLRTREVVDALAQRDLVGRQVTRVEVARALGLGRALVARRTLVRVVEDAAVAGREPGRPHARVHRVVRVLEPHGGVGLHNPQ